MDELLTIGLPRSLTHPGASVGLAEGLVAGFVVAIAVAATISWVTRPQLFICGHNPELDERFSCHAVVIRNVGRRCAESCVGMITFGEIPLEKILCSADHLRTREMGLAPTKFNLGREDEVFLLADGNHRKIDREFLSWSALGNPRVIDIYPKTTMNLDVGRWFRGTPGKWRKPGKPSQFQLTSEDGWRHPRVALAEGEYKAVLTVAAKNAHAKTRHIEIMFSATSPKSASAHPVSVKVMHSRLDRIRARFHRWELNAPRQG